MFPDICYVILTLCCIAWASWVFIFNRRRGDPPLPPGPWGLPVVGSLPFLDPELHSYFKDLAQTYGPLVSLRLGKKIVVVANSPSTAKEVLKDYDVTFANRDVPAVAKVATYGGLDVVWSPYGPVWRMLRKVCVRELLGPATLDTVYKLGKHEVKETMKRLNERPGCGVVDIGELMFATMTNVVMSMLWGDTVKGGERAELEAGFRAAVTDLTHLLGLPNVSDFFPALERLDLQGIVRKMSRCAKKMDGIAEAVIGRRRKMDEIGGDGVEDSKDFLRVLLEFMDSGASKTPFTKVHLKALLLDMIVGGTDTTSNTLEFAMAEILNNPHVMRRAQQELDAVVGSSDAPLEESHILHLPYLQAIMKETLRLHPILPLLVPRCPTQSCVVAGHTVPKGSRVFVNVWAIHRDPSVWEDPLEFKPERFLEDMRPDFSGHDFTYLPFGSGRRICVGVAMAEKMVLYSLASMLRCFDWKLPQGVEKVDVEEKFGITLKKRTPLLLIPLPKSYV